MRHRKRSLRCQNHRKLAIESLEARQLLAVDWRNPVNSLDVTGDGATVPIDALNIINEINNNGSRRLSDQKDPSKPFWDASGDQFLAPLDALQVINALNAGNVAPYRLSEGVTLHSQSTITISLGQAAGTRTYRMRIDATFDRGDAQAVVDDVFAVYLVNPTAFNETLLDRGQPGTALFTLSPSGADYQPGRVSWDGSVLELDVSALSTRDTGVLKLQLLGTDTDTETRITVNPLTNEVDPEGVSSQPFPASPLPQSPGLAINLDAMTEVTSVSAEVENVRFDETVGRLAADVRLRNDGGSLARNVAVAFPDLPVGVTLRNASGTTPNGAPYLNWAPAMPRGGLLDGGRSEQLLVEFDDPSHARFVLTPIVLAGTNHAPTLDAIEPLTTSPGNVLRVSLVAADQDGDSLTFGIRTAGDGSSESLPTSTLHTDGTLEFRPAPNQIGIHTFEVVASDGALEATQSVTLTVVADPVTSTRFSGQVLTVDGQPLANMPVEIGAVQGLTMQDGSFTLDLGSGPVVSDTLRVRGELFAGPLEYPFIAEKLPFLLGHELFAGTNNVVNRPIFLPALDTANAVQINPNVDATVTTAAIPGIALFVEAGTLMNQQGTPFNGMLSITEVPVDLTPAALPSGLFPDLVVTIQPGEMVFAQPAPLDFPNTAGPNGERWAPGTVMDLWSIDPVTGEFDDVGDMEVSADGQRVETISGGVRNSSWHFGTPRPPKPKPEPDEDECEECDEKGEANSVVDFSSGELTETHALPTYQSLGAARGVELVYNSLRADPRPILHAGYEDVNPNIFSVPSALKVVARASVDINGISVVSDGFDDPGQFGLLGGENFWSIPAGGGPLDVALQMDLVDQPTGVYPYSLNIGLRGFTGSRFIGSASVIQDELLHVNTIASPFGAGWGIAGLQEIVTGTNGSVLLVDGDGGAMLYHANQSTISTFDSSDEGWTTLGDATGRTRVTTGGNPGGFMQASDQSLGVGWSWRAPQKFTGNHTPAYGGSLAFDLKQSSTTDPILGAVDDVVLKGAGLTLVFNTPNDPGTDWTHYEIPLLETAGWHLGTLAGRTPTQAEMRLVLGSITELQIRGEYRNGPDTGGLDNVALIIGGVDQSGDFVSPPGDFSTLEQLTDGTFRRTMTDGTVYSFSAQGKLVSIDDRNGNETRYEYDVAGNILKIIDPVLLETTFTYTGDCGAPVSPARACSITDPAGRVTQLTYDNAGNLIRVTSPDGSQKEWEYDARHHVTAAIDERGNRGEDFYDSFGRLTTAIRPDGGIIQVVPRQVRGLYPVDQTKDPANAPFAARTNSSDASYSDANGNVIHTVLDGAGQEVRSTDGVGLLPLVERNEQNLINRLTDARGNVTSFDYDSKGNVVRIRDLTPVAEQLFTYEDTFSRQTSITDELGHQILFEIDPANGDMLSITQVIDVTGGSDDLVTQFTYTQHGLVDTETDPLGRVTDYDYDTLGRLVTLKTAKGTSDEGVQQFEYDSAGNTTATIDENGNRTDYTYDLLNRVTRITEPDPDADGPLTRPTTDFSYDLAGNLATFTDARGNTIRYEYDQRNRATKMLDPESGETRYRYDLAGNLVSMTDPLGHQTRYEYDARDRLVETIDPDNGRTKFRYDADDNTTAVIDPVGNVTRHSYDSRDRLIRETDPLGNQIGYAYDAADNLIRRTEFEATTIATNHQFDNFTDLSGLTLNGAATAINATPVTENGQVVLRLTTSRSQAATAFLTEPVVPSIADLTSFSTSFQFQITGAEGIISDEDGRGADGFTFLLATSPTKLGGNGGALGFSGIGPSVAVEFDTHNNGPTADNSGNHVGIDLNGNLTSIVQTSVSPRLNDGNVWFAWIDYSAATQQLEVRVAQASERPAEPVVAATVDLAAVLGQDDAFVGFSAGTGGGGSQKHDIRSWQFTAAYSSIAARRQIEFAYDDVNRRTTENWVGGGNTIAYSYDKASNLLSATDSFSALAMTYDARDRVRTVDNVGTPGVPNVVLTYAYDPAGNLLSTADTIAGAAGGLNLYTYDGLDRATRITQSGVNVSDKRVDLAYNPLGQFSSLQRFSDLTGAQLVIGSNYTYDSLNRLTGLHHSNAASSDVAFFDFVYDAHSRITRITDIDGATDYAYDDRDELIAANHADVNNPDETYSYDANGNRITSSRHGDGYATGPNNHLLSDGTYDYQYDAEGNLIRRTEIATGQFREFQWDYRNRLIAVIDKTAANEETQRVAFTYDVFDRRLSKAVDTTPLDAVDAAVVHFVYDRDDVLLEFLDPDSGGSTAATIAQRYFHGPAIDQVLAQDKGADEVLWHLADHLGTVRDLISNSGLVENHLTYDSYGNAIGETNASVATRYQFTGREFDPETDLYYVRSRFLDASTGRFMNEDLIGLRGDLNLYRYVGNAPHQQSDPYGYGELPWDQIITMGNTYITQNIDQLLQQAIAERNKAIQDLVDFNKKHPQGCKNEAEEIEKSRIVNRITAANNVIVKLYRQYASSRGTLFWDQSLRTPDRVFQDNNVDRAVWAKAQKESQSWLPF